VGEAMRQIDRISDVPRCPALRFGSRLNGRPLIIGYGNTLRGDDGAGVAAARRLADRLGDAVDVLTAHQLLPELACEIADAAAVVFIDASVALPPGRVAVTPLAATTIDPGPTAHHLTPAALLAMAGCLFGRQPRAHAVAVGVAALDYGERLSPAVDRAVDELTETVAALIDCPQVTHA